MCDHPYLIDNINYNHKFKDSRLNVIKNTTQIRIPVPCGHCSTCVMLKQQYLVQRVQMESISNDLFYGTLTYNSDSLPVVDYGDIKFAYPDFTDWQKMIKMIRKDYPDLKFRYMLVSEYGGKKHRPHFHFILSIPRTSDLLAEKWSKANELFHIFLRYWRRNYGSTRNPIWKPLCTYVRRGNKYNYDLHWLDPDSSADGLDGVSFYVTKYLLKFDDWVLKFKSKLYYTFMSDKTGKYKDAWSKFRPRILLSKGFGDPTNPLVESHILKGINFALADVNAFFPYYISRQNGSTFPLAPYYRRRFLTIDSEYEFAMRRPETDDFTLEYEDKLDDIAKRDFNLGLIKSYLNGQCLLSDFTDMNDINDIIIDYYGEDSRITSRGEEFAPNWENPFSDSDSD